MSGLPLTQGPVCMPELPRLILMIDAPTTDCQNHQCSYNYHNVRQLSLIEEKYWQKHAIYQQLYDTHVIDEKGQCVLNL